VEIIHDEFDKINIIRESYGPDKNQKY